MTFLPKSWQFIAAVEAADDRGTLARALVALAEQFGFTSVFGGIVPPPTTPLSKAAIEPLVMVQHVPEGWGERYNARGYLFRDPVLRRLREDLDPFTWSDSYATCPSAADARLIGGEAVEFGLSDALLVSVSTLDTHRAAVSFGGNRDAPSPEETTALGFAASFAIGHFLRLRAPHEHELLPLTVRELDCLLWASEGKTDWEISVILGIPRSTVTKHIAAAREKLSAANKAHAVALALRRHVLP